MSSVAAPGLNGPVQAPPEPAQDLEAERSVLAAMMLSAEAIDEAGELLQAEAFSLVPHQRIFEAIRALRARSEPADVLTVAAELRARGSRSPRGLPRFSAGRRIGACGSAWNCATTCATRSRRRSP